MGRILIVEDDDLVADLVLDTLAPTGHVTKSNSNGEDALEVVRVWKPDLVVLDLNLGGAMSGLEVCRRIRSDPERGQTLIVVLTGETGEELEIALFDAGADDYLHKEGFLPKLFRARIEAVLRRGLSQASTAKVTYGPLTLNPPRRETLVESRAINLSPTEFDLLHRLVQNPHRVLSRTELLDRGDEENGGTSRAVDVHVLQIRKKLGRFSWLISTVYGAGYRLGSGPDAGA